MEFDKLNVQKDQQNKDAWQDCNSISVAACTPAAQGGSYGGKMYYYHKVDAVTADGNMIGCTFVTNSPEGIIPGDYNVQCKVKIWQGNKTYTFKHATGGASRSYSSNNTSGATKAMTNEFRTPEQIMRGVACEVASKVSPDVASFWGIVQQVNKYIETGELPI